MKKKLLWGPLILIALGLIIFGGYLVQRKLKTNQANVTAVKKTKTKPSVFNHVNQPIDHLNSIQRKTVAKLLTDTHFSGTCLLVRNGKITFLKAFGQANLKTDPMQSIILRSWVHTSSIRIMRRLQIKIEIIFFR